MKIIKQKPTPQAILNLIVFVLIIAGIVFAGIKYAPAIREFYGGSKNVYDMAFKTSEFLKEAGFKSIFIYIGVQILQVVIAAIPGMAIQFAGGMVYGVLMGTIYSLAGITAGSIIVFYISKTFGTKAMSLFIKQETYEKFKHLANSKTAEIIIFILFLIPGLPKDVFSYILGLSPIKTKDFLIYSTLGRLPGIIGSCTIGYTYMSKNYILAGAVFAVSVIFLLLCIIYKDKIMSLISKKDVV